MQSVLVLFLTLSLSINGVRSDVIAKQTIQGADDRKALRFNVTLESVALPGSSIYNVTLISTVTGFMVDPSSFATDPKDREKSSYRTIDDKVLWNYSQLTTAEIAYLAFKATPQFNLPEGKSFYNASLMYDVQPPVNDTSVSLPIISPFCLERVDTFSTEADFNEGLIAVTVIFGLLAGALLVFLILIGIFHVTKRNPFSCREKKDKPLSESSPKFKKPSEASYKSRYDGISGRKSLPWSESIITILRLPEQNDIIREIERLDIEDTMRMCRDLDLHRDEAVLNLAMNLIRDVVTSGSISKKTASSCTTSLLKQLESMERKMDDKLRQQMDDAESLIREEDEKKLGTLDQKHEEEANLLMESLKGTDPQDMKSARKLLKEKHKLERSQLQYRINLRMQEDTEKLVSESSVCKRVARRQLIWTCLSDIATTSSLTPEQLTKEFDRLEMAVAKIFTDAESVRLRTLEEKFAKRKCLVKTQELAQSQGRDVLNTITEQLIQLVDFARKSGKLSQSNARRVTEDIVAEAQEIKRSGEEEEEKREVELLRKLGDCKKNRLADQKKVFEQKLNEIKKKDSSAEMKDSLLLLEVMQTSITRHEQEMAQVETQVDSEHANELLKLQELLREESKQELLKSKDNLIKDLREIGLPSTKMRPWLERHEEELQELQQTHQKESKEQLNDLRKQLSDGVVSLNGTRQHKHQHEEQLATYKQAVVRHLINSQMVLTSDERERVQADLAKEKNNSATSIRALDKLKHRKLMEDKQALKKYDRIEVLRKKQEQELKKLRSVDWKRSKDSDDDEGTVRTSMLLTLFENYYKRCVMILKGEEIVMQDEEVSVELNREQASILKEEEEKLAVGLVGIQIQRMKEFLMADNERTVLRRVICRVMRELAEDDDVLSVTDCQRILQAHEKDLKSTPMSPRDDLKVRNLTESRRKLVDESSKSWDEEDNENQRNEVKSPVAIKLRKVLLLEKQVVEHSVLRNQTEREIRQEVEEIKWNDRLKQIQLSLVKELELLAIVLKGGRYSVEDVENILTNHFLPTSSIDWRHFLHQFSISSEPRATTERTDAKNRLRNTEETNQYSPRTEKAEITPRSFLKLGKLHPLPASVSPAITHDEVDSVASSSQTGSYLYRKPNGSNPRLAQTVPSLRLPPITPSVGSKQKKSVRLVETHNEYWSN